MLWTLGASAAPRSNDIRLRVADIGLSTNFYREYVGLQLIYQSEKSSVFELTEGKLTLIQSKKELQAIENPLLFEVEKLDSKRRELFSAGFAVGPVAREKTFRKFSVSDPDGYVLEFRSRQKGTWQNDIEYVRWEKESLRLDAFVPEESGVFPGIIVVHGGSFTGGNRVTFVQPVLEVLAETGRYAVFTISYRLAPRHRFPKAVEDVQEAVRFVREHASTFKVDASRLALVGESAGGYLVTMASTRLHADEQVQGVVSFYGAQDLPARVISQGKIVSSLKSFFGVTQPDKTTLDLLAKGSPITWVRREAPPHLFIHGTEDELVPFNQSTLMCERMKRLTASCEVLAIEHGRHGMRGWDMDPLKTFYRERLVEWLDEQVLKVSVTRSISTTEE